MHSQIALRCRKLFNNFMVKIRKKNAVSFLHSKINCFFMMQLAKQLLPAEFQPFLKTLVFSTLGATLR